MHRNSIQCPMHRNYYTPLCTDYHVSICTGTMWQTNYQLNKEKCQQSVCLIINIGVFSRIQEIVSSELIVNDKFQWTYWLHKEIKKKSNLTCSCLTITLCFNV